MKLKLSEFRTRSFEYTSKSSDIVRQLILAGVAIIWLFKDKEKNELLASAMYPLICLAVAAIVDLAQYVIGGIKWINFYHRKQREYQESDTDPEFDVPEEKSDIIWVLWYGKILLTGVAYVLIIVFVIQNLKFVTR